MENTQSNIEKMIKSTAYRYAPSNHADREDLEQELRLKYWMMNEPGLAEAQVQARFNNHALDIVRKRRKYEKRFLICGDDTEIHNQQEKDIRVGSADAFDTIAKHDLQVSLTNLIDDVRKSFGEDVRILKLIELLLEHPKMSNVKIGTTIGVSDVTVKNFKRRISTFIRSHDPFYMEYAS